MNSILLSRKNFNPKSNLEIQLSGSKSESNRVLIISELCSREIEIHGISHSEDTKRLQEILTKEQNNKIIEVGPAGTTLRFLLAYFFLIQKKVVLTGSVRMKERPIGILVDALKSLGAKIKYSEKNGFPPIEPLDFTFTEKNEINLNAEISSQFATALLLISPSLPNGLRLNLEGKILSFPYIQMTIDTMRYFGIEIEIKGNQIEIKPQKYLSKPIIIEPDWSSLAYWYCLIALSRIEEIYFPGFRKESKQGDQIIAKIMEKLGVQTQFEEFGVRLIKTEVKTKFLEFNFSDCPDLAPTIIICCSGLQINGIFSGLESLRIKECDRILALEIELEKFGVNFYQELTGNYLLKTENLILNQNVVINTYDDHRIAMAFAPMVFSQKSLEIKNPEVVKKSYPEFWNDLNKFGLEAEIS